MIRNFPCTIICQLGGNSSYEYRIDSALDSGRCSRQFLFDGFGDAFHAKPLAHRFSFLFSSFPSKVWLFTPSLAKFNALYGVAMAFKYDYRGFVHFPNVVLKF
jgi:hypothetical protein